MGQEQNNEADKEEIYKKFIPLNKLLLKDNEEVKKIKSLFKKEVEYSNILFPIEFSIAGYYLDNRKLKDKDVIKTLKKIKQNYFKGFDYFDDELEKMIMSSLSIAIQKRKITRHELFLAFNYVLWSINNRKYLGSRAYLDWLLDFFGDKLGIKEEMQVVTNIKDLPEDELKRLIKLGEKTFHKDVNNMASPKDIKEAKKESEDFARDDEE